jgi:mono/diheme cytochrome c family protein
MRPNNSADHATANAVGAWRLRTIAAIYGLALIFTAIGIGRLAAATGDYTQQQVSAGRQVFNRHCAKCHGGKLQGQAGPPLNGPKFESNLKYSKMSAQQIFTFIKTQMPANAPGSLSKQQYLQALAYILSKNGYPQGSTPLSEETLRKVRMLPYPDRNGGSNKQASTQSKSHSQ